MTPSKDNSYTPVNPENKFSASETNPEDESDFQGGVGKLANTLACIESASQRSVFSLSLDLPKATKLALEALNNSVNNLRATVLKSIEEASYPEDSFSEEDIEQIARIAKILSIQGNETQIDLPKLLEIYLNPEENYSEELQELVRQTIYHEIKRQVRIQLYTKTKTEFLQKYPIFFPSNESIKEELWLKSPQYKALIQGTFDPIQERILIIQELDKLHTAPSLLESLKELARTPLTINFDPENPSNNIKIDISDESNFMYSYLEALQKMKSQPDPQIRQDLLRKIQPSKMTELLSKIGNLNLTTILEESITYAIQESTTLMDEALELILYLLQEQDLSDTSITSSIITEFIKKYKKQIINLVNQKKSKQEQTERNAHRQEQKRKMRKLHFRRNTEKTEKQETLSNSDRLLEYLQEKIETSPNIVDLYKKSKAELELLLLSYAITDSYNFPDYQFSEVTIDNLYDKIQRIHYLQLAKEILSKKSKTSEQDEQEASEQDEQEASDQHYEFLSELQKILTRLNIESELNTTSLYIPNPDQNNYSPRTIKTQGILIQIPDENNLRQDVLSKFERVIPTNRSEENPLTDLFLTYNTRKQQYQLYFIYTSRNNQESYAIEVKIPEPIAILQQTEESDPFAHP